MFNPVSTYRIQFHKEFTFTQFSNIISYLKELGIKTIYASPVFSAVPGSNHGYDGIDPHTINPEIGTEEELKAINTILKDAGMSWLQDIVPNHMAFDPRNKWLMDVLEKGKRSAYAPLFDILWDSNVYEGKIMVPFLGKPLKQAVADNEISIKYLDGRLMLTYFDSGYPLSPHAYHDIVKKRTTNKALKELVQLLDRSVDEENDRWNEFVDAFRDFAKEDKNRQAINSLLEKLNNDQQQLLEICEKQEYRLCYWQETDHHINYRRFFTVNGLICLNIQEDQNFELYHRYILQLYGEGIFQGLRIDHIDGLYDPGKYLDQLRNATGGDAYITIEKILEPGEDLPAQWPVEGNTGYDFLALVNNLFTEKESELAFTKFYQQLTGSRKSIEQYIHDKKSLILDEHMQGELQNLYQLFMESRLIDKKMLSKIHPEDIKETIGEFLIQCPVYRYYPSSMPLPDEEIHALRQVFQRVRRSGCNSIEAVDLVEQVLLDKPFDADEDFNNKALHFLKRCMQFSGPLMAKGVEDTLMYTYHRFIAHNEVGDAPSSFGLSAEAFHNAMKERFGIWPLSINATSTHDTKRGEDVRAQLNVLSDIREAWFHAVNEWQQLNQSLKSNNAPDANDEYFIYQSLVGAYPFTNDATEDFKPRFEQYLEKALREAKLHSNWTTPDAEYEQGVKQFAAALLDKESQFWKSFIAFRSKIVDHGIINSLTQVILKFTCPGVPDTYQGTELWDLSFVDPDNRRPVNYDIRKEMLNEVKEGSVDATSLWQNRYNGQIKLWLIHQLLQLRNNCNDLFTDGEYISLTIEGIYKKNILAFARKFRQQYYVVIVPLHTAAITNGEEIDVRQIDWKDTIVRLPKNMATELQDVILSGNVSGKSGLLIKDIFKQLPFAILKAQSAFNERGAGVLMHISSLPSLFAIGDLGPEALRFADFLNRCQQKYWQLLPLNPTEAGQAHSPYSATSSMAGNLLFISPESLAEEGLLNQAELQDLYQPQLSEVDYEGAERIKKILLDKAYRSFNSGAQNEIANEFETFCSKEDYWLDDFALFSLLKQLNGGKPWYEWDEVYKQREEAALVELRTENEDEMRKLKFFQFQFSRQWHALRTYCNSRNIKLIGDLPFYVSYDSADVWSQRGIFAINEEGTRTGMAGVPPDAFSSDGQLWGMPVFKWGVLKETGYDWWVKRLKKNIELFDIVRLDHFRAFAAYWEVPEGEHTAINGHWIEGPGADFFEVMERELGSLPFVAEDLGDIDEKVLHLRDRFQLPGMKVLQFAFGDDMPQSDYIPHNYEPPFIVYTGTHDNNTTRGWFNTEATEAMRARLEAYIGRAISSAEIHLELSKMAYASVANIAILPLQDILGLDEAARMNVPSSGSNNWSWRLQPELPLSAQEDRLRRWTKLYNRE